MTKFDLIRNASKRANLTASDTQDAFVAIVDQIVEALTRGEKTVIPGLGYLTVITRNARKGRNPKTGEVIDIPEKKAVKLVVAKKLKEQLND